MKVLALGPRGSGAPPFRGCESPRGRACPVPCGAPEGQVRRSAGLRPEARMLRRRLDGSRLRRWRSPATPPRL